MNTTALQGPELIEQGLRDLARVAGTVESLLVSLSAPRLRALGIEVSSRLAALCRLLAAQYGAGAHGRYNVLIRRVVSFQ